MEKRAMVLRRVARMLAGHRAELLEVMASETGKTFEQGDPEVSEAIDFALYYAEQAERLDREKGVIFSPRPLTLRSEERRVGKEGISGWARNEYNKSDVKRVVRA